RSERRGDRRSFGVVDEQYAADVSDAFHAMRQPPERAERREHLVVDLRYRRRKCKGRERVQRVVTSDQLELARRSEQRTAAREPRAAFAIDQTPIVLAF